MAQSRAKKRFIISAFLGLVAGLVCVWLASTGSNPNIWGLKSWVMWAIITNRLLLGVVIGFAGAFTHHPVCGFPIPWYVRGVFAGVVVSLTLAFSGLAANGVVSIFWYTLLAGAVYGLVIDFFATKFGGEGKEIAG